MSSSGDPTSMRHELSRDGFDFILSKEGDGSRLYWPGGLSGVTIGHGYDLKDRWRGDVESELRRAGINPIDAAVIAEGAGLRGSAADEFARKHTAIAIGRQEQARLLEMELRKYVDEVNHLVRVPLTQRQFDALVSFAYNEGISNLRGSRLLRDVNDGNFAGAAKEFEHWTIVGRRSSRGLAIRRGEESRAFGSW